jgi:hypothetical protein
MASQRKRDESLRLGWIPAFAGMTFVGEAE